MKRIRVCTAVMALVLTVSPIGALRVSAAETETVPTQESGENVTQPQVSELEFTDEWRVKFKWNNGSSQNPSFLIKILKDGEVCYEGATRFVFTGGIYQMPFSRVIEESGSYQVKVWALNTYKPATSEVRSYTRPEAVLGTTTGYWDENQEGLFHYPAVKDAAGYAWRLLKYNDESGQWETKHPIYHNEYGFGIGADSVAFVGPWKTSPKDAGGEDKTIDFSEEIKLYGAGSYCVSVKALSGDVTEIANGAEGEKSPALIVSSSSDDSGSNDAGSSDDSASADSFVFAEGQIEQAKSGDTIKITKDQNVTSLSNSDMKQLLERGDVALEMEYTYDGVDYKIRIPVGKALNNDIPWYGPLYLAAHYGVDRFGTASDDASNYTVKAGDSLSKIARDYKMTLKELVARNPQIQNLDVISIGQKITIK